MSVQFCHTCGRDIDTDMDVEHFCDLTPCVNEATEQFNELNLCKKHMDMYHETLDILVDIHKSVRKNGWKKGGYK